MQMALVFSAPVIIFSAYDSPLLASGVAIFSSILAKITKTPYTIDASADAEHTLISGLRITSSRNRIVRIVLGLLHILATIKLALKGQKELETKQEKKSTVVTLLSQAYNLFGIVLLANVAGIWFSTGVLRTVRQRCKGFVESRWAWMANDAGVDQGTLFEPTSCNIFISNESFNSYKFAT